MTLNVLYILFIRDIFTGDMFIAIQFMLNPKSSHWCTFLVLPEEGAKPITMNVYK